MSLSRKGVTTGVSLILAVLLLVGGSSTVLGNSNSVQAEVADSIIEKLLTFIHSAARIIGSGLVQLVDLIAGVNMPELEEPLG